MYKTHVDMAKLVTEKKSEFDLFSFFFLVSILFFLFSWPRTRTVQCKWMFTIWLIYVSFFLFCFFSSSSFAVCQSFQVVLMLCKLRPQYTFSHTRKSQPPLLGMVALAIALPPPSVHEIRLETDMFVTRINFNFTIAHCEPKYVTNEIFWYLSVIY